MKRPTNPGACRECGQPPPPVVGEDGFPVVPLVDGLCWFCRKLPKLAKPRKGGA